MKNHFSTIFLILSLCALSLTAQAQIRISGTVADKDGAPVIGAGIVERGTPNGTVSDNDEQYIVTRVLGPFTAY